jgi:hypothetical protein
MPSNIEMAHSIASAAACLDDLQSARPGSPVYLQTRAAAIYHANKLHGIAQQLAGDRGHEIYQPADASLHLITRAASAEGVPA